MEYNVCHFFVFLCLTFVKKRTLSQPEDISFHTRKKIFSQGNGDLVMVFSTKDVVKLANVERILEMRDIDFTVIDRHGAAMLSFLPDVEIRIMVPKKNFDESRKAIREIMQ